MAIKSTPESVTVQLYSGGAKQAQVNIRAVLVVIAVLAGRQISTALGTEQFKKPLLKRLWISLQGTFAELLDDENSPSEGYPNLEDLELNEVLLAGTTLRIIAASVGMRDELDVAMDPVYTAAYGFARSRSFANKDTKSAA